MSRTKNKTALALAISFAVCLQFSYNDSDAQNMSDGTQTLGRISECQRDYIKIDNLKFFLTTDTRIRNQAGDAINLAEINRRGLVQVTVNVDADRLVAEEIKRIDITNARRQQSFSGRIDEAAGNRFIIDGKTFHFDEFTVRVGEIVKKGDLQKWPGMNVIVVAAEKASGVWVAEFIREDFETTAMVE